MQSYGSGDSGSQAGIPKALQGNPGQQAVGKVGLVLCTTSSHWCERCTAVLTLMRG